MKNLFIIFLIFIFTCPTDYTKIKPRLSPVCEKKLQECGEFHAPKPLIGSMTCRLANDTCNFLCNLKCPKKDGKQLQISDKRYAREIYFCSDGKWMRKDSPKAFCLSSSPVKEVRQNFHHIDELNSLIKSLFNSSYNFISMVTFYDRADVALPGFSKFMSELWEKEIKLARSMLSYMNKRGGFVSLFDVPSPKIQDQLLYTRLQAKGGLAGMEAALNILKSINHQALSLHKLTMMSKKVADPHLKFYLEDGILNQRVDDIKKVAEIITRLKSFSDEDYPLGEFEVDLQLRSV